MFRELSALAVHIQIWTPEADDREHQQGTLHETIVLRLCALMPDRTLLQSPRLQSSD